MRKLLLVGLIAAIPMLVAPSSASAWGWGHGRHYGYARAITMATARRTIATTTRRATTATPTTLPRWRFFGPRVYGWRGWGARRWGMGRLAPLVAARLRRLMTARAT